MFFTERTFTQFANQPAVKSSTEVLDYQSLNAAVEQACLGLKPRDLVFLYVASNVSSLTAYLACLRISAVAVLLNADLSVEKKQKLEAIYQPNLIFANNTLNRIHSKPHDISADVALLLTTSGTTGSAKFVALSYANLQSNAQSICDYLPIEPSDITLANLPLFYSYGLSVVNSHLNKGACIYLSDVSVMQKAFWTLLDEAEIASFAGVPTTYTMLARLGFTKKIFPNLRYFTQAGGKLAPQFVKRFAEYAKEHDKQFFVMYGQTEATARIAYLKPEKARLKPSSIGGAIPGGKLFVAEESDDEILYQGPNVMLGYVEVLDDLCSFSPCNTLKTGDLGYQDEDGDWHITGRAKRFIKLFGERVNLDDIENWLSDNNYEAACCGNDNALNVFISSGSDFDPIDLKQKVADYLNVHSSVTQVVAIEQIPVNANGKRDYQQMMAKAAEVL